MKVYPKEYVFASGFYAAVVSPIIEDSRVLTTIRYYQDESGDVEKLSTTKADKLLEKIKPDYRFYVKSMDVYLHGIPLVDIDKIIRPNESIDSLVQLNSPDQKQIDAMEAYRFISNSGVNKDSLGITGSIALGFHNEASDVDMVVYGRDNFKRVRSHIEKGVEEKIIQDLDDKLWMDTYERRNCDLDFETYLFHEKRKFNKFKINNSKVDVSLVLLDEQSPVDTGPYKKLGNEVIQATVIDDSQVFDLPARYFINNEKISEVVCHTVTYAGQAFAGETIEISGVVEVDQNNDKRLVVGTSREATGEYIKLIRPGSS